MKVLGESEILASLNALKLYSIAEMIRKTNEKKKNPLCPLLTEKIILRHIAWI